MYLVMTTDNLKQKINTRSGSIAVRKLTISFLAFYNDLFEEQWQSLEP